MIPAVRHVLAARRARAGWSLRQFAAFTSIGYSSLSRWEAGKDGTTNLDRIVTEYATALHATPREIWAEALDLYTRDLEGHIAAAAARGAAAARELASDLS